ncbi:MAG: M24 family metallopeptidase [Omnitrophica bacterium]|nr:M24 family metallopeptidase [Candidatus Omnitrophota bacterium]
MRKSKNAIRNLTEAAKITKNIFTAVRPEIKPGASEREIARKIENLIMKRGLRRSFTTIVASGPNAAKPHAKLTDRKIKKNDLVVVDFGAIYKGQRGDMTRTVIIGKMEKRMRELYNAVATAHKMAIKKIRPGIKISDFVQSINRYMRKKGFEKHIRHTLGHGIGTRIHEGPKLSEKNNRILKEGMVVTIEPGLYVDGKGGVRIEDAVCITKNGARVLAT